MNLLWNVPDVSFCGTVITMYVWDVGRLEGAYLPDIVQFCQQSQSSDLRSFGILHCRMVVSYQETTILRCITSQKSADLIYIAVEA